jgi:hypothetical protein
MRANANPSNAPTTSVRAISLPHPCWNAGPSQLVALGHQRSRDKSSDEPTAFVECDVHVAFLRLLDKWSGG